MREKEHSDVSSRLGDRKTALVAAGLVVLLVLGLIVAIIIFGTIAGDPRGDAIGPGP